MLFCKFLTVLILVLTDTGGVSCFSRMQYGWDNRRTWVLPDTAQLPNGLEAHKDRQDHWLIGPSKAMSYDDFVGDLTKLNGLAVRYDEWLQNK